MTEQTTENERPKAERCPFCHSELGANEFGWPEEARDERGQPNSTNHSGDTRVACARCAAPHHAECFVENRGCAATACGCAEARVEGRADPLPVGLIDAEVRGHTIEALSAPRARFGTVLLPLGIVMVVALALVAGVGGIGPAVGLAVIFAIVLGVVAMLLSVTPELPEARVAEEGEPLAEAVNPVLGQAYGQLWQPDAFTLAKERIDAEAPEPEPEETAPPPARSPAQCPLCKRDLEREPGEETLRFCYHCGAALG